MPFLPVTHPFPRGIKDAGRDGVAFVADAVNGDDAAAFHLLQIP
jgi:hypothetical protein